MPTEILTEKAIENIRFDLANTKPVSSPMGLFRQHCEDLLGEREVLQSQLEQLRAENRQLRSSWEASDKQYAAQLNEAYQEKFNLQSRLAQVEQELAEEKRRDWNKVLKQAVQCDRCALSTWAVPDSPCIKMAISGVECAGIMRAIRAPAIEEKEAKK